MVLRCKHTPTLKDLRVVCHMEALRKERSTNNTQLVVVLLKMIENMNLWVESDRREQ